MSREPKHNLLPPYCHTRLGDFARRDMSQYRPSGVGRIASNVQRYHCSLYFQHSHVRALHRGTAPTIPPFLSVVSESYSLSVPSKESFLVPSEHHKR